MSDAVAAPEPGRGPGPSPRTVRQRGRRPRTFAAVLVIVLFAAGFAAFAAVPLGTRFFLLDAPLFAASTAPACWITATALYAVAVRTRFGHRAWVAAVVTTAGTMLSVSGVVLASMIGMLTPGVGDVAAVESAPDGRHELVAETYFAVIDPSCRVYLRERAGPFSRQVVVWNRQDAPCPERMEFAAGDRIRIVEAEVVGRPTEAPLTTGFDPGRMRVEETLGDR